MPEWQVEDGEWRRGKSRWAYQSGNGANRRRRMGSAESPGRQTSAQFASSAVPLLRSSSKISARISHSDSDHIQTDSRMIKVLPVSHSNLALLIFLILFASAGAFAQTSIHTTPNLFTAFSGWVCSASTRSVWSAASPDIAGKLS